MDKQIYNNLQMTKSTAFREPLRISNSESTNSKAVIPFELALTPGKNLTNDKHLVGQLCPGMFHNDS